MVYNFLIPELLIMKNPLLLFVIVLFLSAGLSAQYIPKSPYLQNPSLAIAYVDSCARFWFPAYDNTRGGFYTNIDRAGNVITSWGTNKNMMTQSRDAYGMVRAFMLTGDETFLTKGRLALNFMYNKAWDNTYGGWLQVLDINGTPVSGSNNTKTAFHQHYALVGPVAYFEATRDTMDYNRIIRGYNSLETNLWDSRSDYFGYYDKASANWTGKTNKSFNATVDAVTTHLLYLYLMTYDDKYKTRLLQIADNMMNRLVASMPAQQIGFAEAYDSYWNVNNAETMTIMGHVLKTAWCLGRIHQLFPDTNYIIAAKKLVTNVLQRGYDHQYGGPYKDYNRVTGAMLMWGNPDTAKAWWQMEQAITAGLMLYDITGDDPYLEMADESLDFFMKYFVDHQYGEVYENRKRSGPLTWGDHKGNDNKGAYHSTELGYYTYLYGKLFYKKEPASLYYKFDAASTARSYPLNPLACNLNKLRITSVTKDGLPYNDFNASTRVINLPANTGGKFYVTYEIDNNTYAEDVTTAPVEFSLSDNYPNPFNPSTKIKFSLPSPSQGEGLGVRSATLKVYDILGNEVATLINEQKAPGNYEVEFNSAQLPSGVYIYRLQAGNFVCSKKMILAK